MKNKGGRQIAKAVGLVMALFIVSRVLGLVRQMVVGVLKHISLLDFLLIIQLLLELGDLFLFALTNHARMSYAIIFKCHPIPPIPNAAMSVITYPRIEINC